MHYVPITLPFFFFLSLLFGFLIILVEIDILQYAYEKIGINKRYIFTVLFLSLFGSYVNIPITQLPVEPIHSSQVVNFYGMPYVVPTLKGGGTIIAVNLGGAVIPVILSIYLLAKNRLYGRGFLAMGVVAVIVHAMAHPVKGVGIAVPTFIPPLVATGVALLLCRKYVAPLAYVAGSLGTLVGGDLLNLNKIQGLGAPIASIGGAGTFDGIFFTGVFAVLLAGIITGKPHPSPSS